MRFSSYYLICVVGIMNVGFVSQFALEVLAYLQHKQLNKAYDLLPKQHSRRLLYYLCVAAKRPSFKSTNKS